MLDIRQKRIAITLAILACIGLIDSIYLTVVHYQTNDLVCNIFDTCDIVLSSHYSVWFGIPVALFGSILYGFILLAAGTAYVRNNVHTLLVAAIMGLIGFIASIWFVYLQVFVLQAFCEYCMVSAVTSLLLCIVSIIVIGIYRKTNSNSTPINNSAAQAQ